MGELDSTVIDMQRILERGKPLVHFDSTDTMAQWAAPLVARRKNRYYRCHLDERAALRLALETLVSAGHTRIGVPWFSSSKADWVPQRMERIQEVARTMDSAPTLVCIEQKEPFWRYVDEFDLRTYRQEIEVAIEKEEPTMVAGVSSHVPFGARLMKHTPSLREILGPGRATAILSLNDLMARELYLWTTYTGTRVPGDLSIVTLDNSLTCRNIPVSTIDFGFARLGYLAAHILIGDIPVQADKDGNIPGRPMLIERGSIAAPRSSAP
jgi:DNA-binding LacI/PurR family transcriptional regulator